MPFVDLDLPAGFYANGTDLESSGRYHEGNLVRFFADQVRPIGGWRQRSQTALTGSSRSIVSWKANNNQLWAGIGTHTNLYAMTQSGAVTDITPVGFTAGRADAENGGGYGAGAYGSGTYGLPIQGTDNIIDASVWSLDVWGENLVGCMDGSDIYEWVPSSAQALPIANAPTAQAIFVTDQRQLVALGADNNPRRVSWSDIEDNTDWTANVDDQAGGRNLATTGKIQSAVNIPSGFLVFTDTDVHRFDYLGPPFVFNMEKVADGSGSVSRKSAIEIDGQVIWMGPQGFWSYNGFPQSIKCDVQDHVFTNINRAQISKVTAFHNSSYGEVTWFYPDNSSTENNSYVTYSYNEGHWTFGKLDRLAAADQSPFPYPLMTGADGHVYEHEVGFNHQGVNPYLKGGPIQLGNGDSIAEVHMYMPDTRTIGDGTISFCAQYEPHGTPYEYGPYTVSKRTDMRLSGRQIAVRYDMTDNLDWRIGKPRVDIKIAGKR